MNYFLIGLIVVLLGIIIYLIFRKQGDGGLTDEIKEIRKEMAESKEKDREVFLKQLEESGKMGRNMTSHIKTITSQLEKIHSDNKQTIDATTKLGKLTDVLLNPKQRGVLGEYFLETLLKNTYSPNGYKLQYEFKDGKKVDAVIFIKEKIIPIDSKFSLENYNRILEEKDVNRRKELEKLLKQDLKKRIDETAEYIRPSENTTDFAFMFIPSEGVYYDIISAKIGIIKAEGLNLIEYALYEKRVVIVSPNTLTAFLQTVVQGLRALKVEESTKEILKGVEILRKHVLKYNELMNKLGSHLGTTVSTYDKAHKELGKIVKDTVKLTGGQAKIEPKELEKPKNIE